jgi:hypothetical protein
VQTLSSFLYIDTVKAQHGNLQARCLLKWIDATDEALLLGNHLMVYHWFPMVQTVYQNIESEYLTETSAAIEAGMMTVPLILIIIMFLAIVVVVWYLLDIRRIMHFCLESLSMMDPEVVLGHPRLTAALGGVFTPEDPQTTAISVSLHAVTEYSSYIIFEVTSDLIVHSLNPAALSRWHLKASECENVDLSLVFTFDPDLPSVFENAENTFVRLITEQLEVPVSFCVFPLETDKTVTGYMYFFEDLREKTAQNNKLAAEQNRAAALVKGVVPDGVSVSPNEASLLYQADWIAVLAVQISGFPDVAAREDAGDALKHFREALGDYIENRCWISHAKTVGVTEYLVINAGGQLTKSEDMNECVWRTCIEIASLAKPCAIPLQFGATTETGAPMGLLSEDHLSFEVFARCVKAAKIIASRSRANALLVDKSVFASFPTALNLPANPVCFKYGEIAYQCYDCPLPEELPPAEEPAPPVQDPAAAPPANPTAPPQNPAAPPPNPTPPSVNPTAPPANPTAPPQKPTPPPKPSPPPADPGTRLPEMGEAK